MKNIRIRKCREFSPKSKILIHTGSLEMHLSDFGIFSVSINTDGVLYASYLWTGSNKINYGNLDENMVYDIKPRLNKMLAIFFGIVFIICSLVFIITHYQWSFVPLIPFSIYILTYLSILKDRYLIIEPVTN